MTSKDMRLLDCLSFHFFCKICVFGFFSLLKTKISKGLFLGVGIHDTSQVLAASLIHFDLNGNSNVLETATLTKLIRNLFLALLIPYLAIKVQSNSLSQTGLLKQVSNNIPLFVYGFKTPTNIWFSLI